MTMILSDISVLSRSIMRESMSETTMRSASLSKKSKKMQRDVVLMEEFKAKETKDPDNKGSEDAAMTSDISTDTDTNIAADKKDTSKSNIIND